MSGAARSASSSIVLPAECCVVTRTSNVKILSLKSLVTWSIYPVTVLFVQGQCILTTCVGQIVNIAFSHNGGLNIPSNFELVHLLFEYQL